MTKLALYALRAAAALIAAWLLIVAAVGLYRFAHDGWTQALIPSIAATFLAYVALNFAARGRE